MRSDTAMSAAMEAAGMTPQRAHVRMQIALAVNRLQAEGVPADLIGEELQYAKRRLGEAYAGVAANGGHPAPAPAQPTEGDAAGQNANADNGHGSVARPSPNQRNATGHPIASAHRRGRPVDARALRQDRDGGRKTTAGNGRPGIAPAREPSAVDIAAMRRVRQAIAVTVLDTFRVRDGRSIGDVTFGEIGRMQGSNLREAMLLKLCRNHVANAEPGMKLRDAIGAETMQRYIQKSAEMADALI